MISSLTFITGNPAKAEQLGRHLDFPIEHLKLDLPEMQGVDLHEIVSFKAAEAYNVVRKPVLVEDAGLVIHAMGKLPGPLVKWFLKELDNSGIAHLVNVYEDRSARAEVVFGLHDGEKVHFFDGSMDGSIAQEPRGDRGFGWDPIFIPKGWEKTWGEMSIEEQAQTSMRKIALKKMEEYLRRKINIEE